MSGSGTINAKSTTSFSSSGTLYIDSEIFTYTGVTATTFTGVTRATSSTTAAAHAANAVYLKVGQNEIQEELQR